MNGIAIDAGKSIRAALAPPYGQIS